MKNFNFSGSYFKVGVQKGKIYRRCGLKNLNFPINHEHLKKQKAIYEKFYPEYFEELKGIAFVTKSSIEQIENFFLGIIKTVFSQFVNIAPNSAVCTLIRTSSNRFDLG